MSRDKQSVTRESLIRLVFSHQWDSIEDILDTDSGRRAASANLEWATMAVGLGGYKPAPPSLIAIILRRFPQMVKEGTLSFESLMKHDCLITNREVVTSFVEADPDVIYQPNEQGDLPIHLIFRAIEFGTKWENFPVGLFMTEQTVHWKNKEGAVAGNSMYLSGIGREFSQIAQKLFEMNPECLFGHKGALCGYVKLKSYRLRETSGGRPLDSGIHRYIRRLFRAAFPLGHNSPDKYGRLPIHFFCEGATCAPFQVAQILLDEDDQCAQHGDGEGRLPLNTLVQAYIGMAKRLLPKYGPLEFNSPWCEDSVDAVFYYGAAKTIPTILSAYPQAISRPDAYGVSALSTVLSPDWPDRWLSTTLTFIETCKKYEDIGRIRFDDGQSPLNLWLNTKQPRGDVGLKNEITESLVSVECSASIRDSGTDLMPFVSAALSGQHLEVLYRLLRAHPDVLVTER